MSYTGPVTTTTAVTFNNTTSGGISMSSTLTVVGNTTFTAPSTSVSVSGAVTATGASAGTDGYDLTVTAGGAVTFGAAIDASGGAISGGVGPNGGDVDIESTGGNVSVYGITTSGTDGVTTGGNAGDISLKPAGTCTDGALGCIPNGRIILNGNLTASQGTGTTEGTDGTILLSSTGRSTTPSIATIISSYAGNDVTITGGTLIVGPNESISVLGDFTATLSSHMVASDIIALDTINITTPLFVFQSHGSEEILLYTGSLAIAPAEHVISRANTSTITTIVGDTSKIGTVSLSQADFLTELQYTPSSYVLNYSATTSPVYPPTPAPIPIPPTPAQPLAEFVIEVGIADAGFNDLLDYYNKMIMNSKYYLEDKCIDGDKENPDCYIRKSIEYRKYP